jgi:hypothetical protein
MVPIRPILGLRLTVSYRNQRTSLRQGYGWQARRITGAAEGVRGVATATVSVGIGKTNLNPGLWVCLG